MKRRMSLVLMITLAFLTLSGCKIEETGLDEGEMNQVAEYTAKLLLRHVRGYQPQLLEKIEVQDDPSLVNEDFEVLGEEPKEKGKEELIPEENETETSEAGGKTLKDVYGVDGLDAVFGGAGEFVKYPKNEGYFSLVPPEGMKLFVATVILKNTSSKELHFVHDKGIEYSLNFYKEGKVFKPGITLLEKDIKFLDVKLKAGESTNGVVVFNIPKSLNKKDVNLVITGNGVKYEISVSQ